MKIKIKGDYAERRHAEYPPLADFVDAYVQERNGDSAPMADYLAKVAAVKAKFPKTKPRKSPKS